MTAERRLRARTVEACALASAFLLIGSHEAQAYIDPGSGALVLQALVAFVAGGLFTVRRSVRRTFDRVAAWRQRPDNASAES